MTGPSLRPVTPGDEELLLQIYASTRAAELALVDWDDRQKEAFVRQQFDAQRRYYNQVFPDAVFAVVEVRGVPVGRIYRDETPGETHVIDIAVLTEHRGRGIGTALMSDVLAAAGERGAFVTIHVECTNPALHWYRRLGFEVVEDQGVYLLLRWRPSVRPAAEAPA